MKNIEKLNALEISKIDTNARSYDAKGWKMIARNWNDWKTEMNPGKRGKNMLSKEIYQNRGNYELGNRSLLNDYIELENFNDDFKAFSELRELKNYMKMGYLLEASRDKNKTQAANHTATIKAIIKLENLNNKDAEKKYDFFKDSSVFEFLKIRESSRYMKSLPSMVTLLRKNNKPLIAGTLNKAYENHKIHWNKFNQNNPVNSESKASKIFEFGKNFYSTYDELTNAMRKADIQCSPLRCFAPNLKLVSTV